MLWKRKVCKPMLTEVKSIKNVKSVHGEYPENLLLGVIGNEMGV